VQSCWFVSPVQPHVPSLPPPPPQVFGAVHVPQVCTLREPSQLSKSASGPQSRPWRWQKRRSVSGVQVVPGSPHTPARPLPAQVAGGVQVPQEPTCRAVPHLSVASSAPQSRPALAHSSASDSELHPVFPHRPCWPPPPQV